MQFRFPFYDYEELLRVSRELAFNALHFGKKFSYDAEKYMDTFDARCQWERDSHSYDRHYHYFFTYWNDFYYRIFQPIAWRKNVTGMTMLCDF